MDVEVDCMRSPQLPNASTAGRKVDIRLSAACRLPGNAALCAVDRACTIFDVREGNSFPRPLRTGSIPVMRRSRSGLLSRVKVH